MTGERTSIDELLAQGGWLGRLAAILVRDAADRDDLVQEVWLAALRQPPRRGQERSWLRSVLRRRVAESWRRRPDQAEFVETAVTDDPAEALAILESHALLGQALRELAEPYRGLIVARYLRGETPRAIARRLGRPAATVRTQLSRGLAMLRERLDRDQPTASWASVLLPLALSAPKVGTLVTGGGIGGLAARFTGVVMSQKSIVVAVALSAAIVAWLATTLAHEDGPELDRGDRQEAAATPAARRSPSGGEVAAATGTEETEAAPDLVEERAELVLELRDPDGAAIAGARVLIFRDEDLLVDGRSDERGRLRRPGRAGRASVVVLAPGRPWWRREIELAGHRRLDLEEGAILSGQVRVAGGLPYRELELRLWQDDADREELPPAIAALVWPLERRRDSCLTKVAGDGSFRFRGLLPGQALRLELGQGFAFREPDRHLGRWRSLPAPTENLVLEVIAVPRVTGRLVDASTLAPIPWQPVVLNCRYDEIAWSTTRASSDADGRFVIGSNVLDFDELRLSVPRGGELIEVLHADEGFADTVDLGDVALAPLGSWRFLVVDPAGRPLANAVVMVASGSLQARTDAEGEGEIRGLGAGIDEAMATALDHGARRFAIERADENRQRIVLAPVNRLEVVFEGAPADFPAQQLVVHGPRALMPDGFDYDLQTGLGARAAVGVSESEDHFELIARPGPDGIFRLQDLRPGVRFRIEIRDLADQLLAEQDGVELTATEQRRLTLRFDANRRKLVVIRILDEDGEPLADAEVITLDQPRMRFASESFEVEQPTPVSDDDGRVLYLRDLRQPPAGIRIELEGYESVEIDAASLNTDRLRVQLRRQAD
ncbi:MAG: sigma-70 family RNA polymerase sigma factor [Planctomycetes bacterium]|nr:sigma-70 family RNA polymerase sigma factor [Planctomycetota bacterium]